GPENGLTLVTRSRDFGDPAEIPPIAYPTGTLKGGPMANLPLRAGMLGVGTIATAPYGFLPGLMEMKDELTLVAVADPAIERARSVAAQYGVPEVYGSLEEMLESSDIDLVINLTPIPLHGSTSMQILKAGKHLVVEKPIATTMED